MRRLLTPQHLQGCRKTCGLSRRKAVYLHPVGHRIRSTASFLKFFYLFSHLSDQALAFFHDIDGSRSYSDGRVTHECACRATSSDGDAGNVHVTERAVTVRSQGYAGRCFGKRQQKWRSTNRVFGRAGGGCGRVTHGHLPALETPEMRQAFTEALRQNWSWKCGDTVTGSRRGFVKSLAPSAHAGYATVKVTVRHAAGRRRSCAHAGRSDQLRVMVAASSTSEHYLDEDLDYSVPAHRPTFGRRPQLIVSQTALALRRYPDAPNL